MSASQLPQPAVEFCVYGVPAPKGSKKAFPHRTTGRVVVVDDNPPRLRDWTRAVNDVLQGMAESGTPRLEGALYADITFYMPKPASAPKRRKTWPDRKPDRDKLERALLDAMTGIVFRDDAQVVDGPVRKRYADDDPADQRPRAEVRLWRMEDLEREQALIPLGADL